jgi:hypothetical protein
MKKVTLLLLLIPWLASGQMRIESHRQELFKGVKLNYKVYYSPTPTNNWVLFLHGSGEGGPADGSLLDKVETNGLTKYALTNTYNFNILAPQALKLPGDKTSRFESIRSVIVDLVKERYHADKIIVTGISQGGMEAVDWGFRDKKGYINGIIVMCGKTSYSRDIPRSKVKDDVDIAWTKYRDIPFIGVHGTKDKAPYGVSYTDGEKVYKALLATPSRKSKTHWIRIDGGDHASSWIKGYDKNDPVGKQVFAFIKAVFENSRATPGP